MCPIDKMSCEIARFLLICQTCLIRRIGIGIDREEWKGRVMRGDFWSAKGAVLMPQL